MKRLLVLLALVGVTFALHAQGITTATVGGSTTTTQVAPMPEQTREDMLRFVHPSFGDYFDGYSRAITYDRMIPPYGLEVTFEKTVHLIFPAGVVYVDLGSDNLIAAKADGAENVVRVKAAVRGFESETNLAVITSDGGFYTFNVKYAEEPRKLNVEMKDFMHDGAAVNRPNNAMDIYLRELGQESPLVVKLIMRSIYKNDRRHVKHIGSRRFGVQNLLKGVFTHNNLIYLHTQIHNESNVPFDVDFVRMKIVDKKVAKRTAIQETVIYPVRAHNYVTEIPGKTSERTVFAIDKITIYGRHFQQCSQ